jgi:hypothetical protein
MDLPYRVLVLQLVPLLPTTQRCSTANYMITYHVAMCPKIAIGVQRNVILSRTFVVGYLKEQRKLWKQSSRRASKHA